MATTNVNIRMDEKLKKQAEELFADLGMNMTTAINIFVRQSVSYGGIPFEIIRRDGFYNDYNQQILKKSISQLDAGKGFAHELIEAADE
ncbi:type II toxin-antitoxin system RelB/DinJ family antitoxin [Desulfitibacter alkalitolerans]|uniref:type II toxin-antitoxin system RelB/DinJ family antitoxin n=1 Tax=Desulfitibacter alkalitolerans TaxID=264641 RepID=UPI0004813104|nr:type II toxin-antitoxin system RelB/DinJ family antitoxin [Desulfitibacter alkalitolerans]